MIVWWHMLKYILLAEVCHDEAKWNDRRETSAAAGFWRVVWWSRLPNFWSKLAGFQNRFGLMCNARALLDCTLIIIEPTVDYGFHEIREFRSRCYHLPKRPGNFGWKSSGSVIFRKIRSEIEDYLQRWSGTAEISLPFAKFELQMVSAISFGWFVDFGKTLTVI